MFFKDVLTNLQLGLLERLHYLLLLNVIRKVGDVGSEGAPVWDSLIVDAWPESSPGRSGEHHHCLLARLVALLLHLVRPVACHSHGSSGAGARGPVGTASLISEKLIQVEGLALLLATFFLNRH